MNRTKAISCLKAQLGERVLLPDDSAFRAATVTWARTAHTPVAIARCANVSDVQVALRAAREAELSLSVRGGGHDVAGRTLCDGLVLDLSGMRQIVLAQDKRSARVGGGALAADLLRETDAARVAPVSGAAGMVGVAGLTLGGGYGPLIGRFGLACDNLLAAEVVLADGRVVTASARHDAELFWALRGGGGNFGVVTELLLALHVVPSVYAGAVFYPFEQAQTVLRRASALCESAPDALTVQLGMLPGPGGAPMVLVAPTWSGPAEGGRASVEPWLSLGTPVAVDVGPRSFGESCTLFDPYIVNGRHTALRTRWVSRMESSVIDLLIAQVRGRPSALCSVLTHEFRGSATRVAPGTTAFGFRAPHVLIEILAQVDPALGDGAAEHAWVKATADRLAPHALAGSYANMSSPDEVERVTASFGPNAARLSAAKRTYDPWNVFSSPFALA